MRIQIINGPNINLLGKREPSIYGSVTFEDYLAELRKKYADVQIDYFQSNIEGELIDKIQQVGFDVDGIILKKWTAQEAADYIGKWAVEMTHVHRSARCYPFGHFSSD